MKQFFKHLLVQILNFLTPVRVMVFLFAGLFFWFLAFGDRGINQLRRLLQMKNQLKAEQTQVNDEVDRLTREKELLSNPANLEMEIRKELGYIRPGEIIFEEKKKADRTDR